MIRRDNNITIELYSEDPRFREDFLVESRAQGSFYSSYFTRNCTLVEFKPPFSLTLLCLLTPDFYKRLKLTQSHVKIY